MLWLTQRALTLIICFSAAAGFGKSPEAASLVSKKSTTSSKEKTKYGLAVGETAPRIKAQSIKGFAIDSESILKKGPLLVVFYRGGWCPFCNLHLKKIERKVLYRVEAAGGQILAISVDLPEQGKGLSKRARLSFPILSDPDAKLLKQYKVAYKLSKKEFKDYSSKGYNLEKSSGRKHHMIAVPALYVVGTDKKIAYAYVNENYKVRAPTADVIRAIERAAGNVHP